MRKIAFVTALLFAVVITINAQVSPTGTYSPIGDVLIDDVSNDGDNGDGTNDGAKYIDGQSTEVGQGVKFTFKGTIEQGVEYAITTTIYNPDKSYCGLNVSLFNATTNTELTTPVNVGILEAQVEAVTINYTGTAQDAGDKLELRYVRNDDGAAYRNFAIDILELDGVAVTQPVMSAEGTWRAIGETSLTNTTNDADNGDGENDGAIYVDGISGSINLGAAYAFSSLMTEGDNCNIVTNVYNSDNSYNKVVVSLYNTTDNTELVSSGVTNVPGGSTQVTISLNYTAVASDEGDELEIRFINAMDAGAYRNFSIDNVSVAGSEINTDLSTLAVDQELLEAKISVYPVPATEVINLKSDNSLNVKSVVLYDSTGKAIYNDTFKSTINVAGYTRGIYYLILKTDNGNSISKQVILK